MKQISEIMNAMFKDSLILFVFLALNTFTIKYET